MTTTAELERELVRDLDTLGDRLTDERFSADLYRALAGRRWRKQGVEGAVSPSRQTRRGHRQRAARAHLQSAKAMS